MFRDLIQILTPNQKKSAIFIIIIYIIISFLDLVSIGLVIPFLEIIQNNDHKSLNFLQNYFDIDNNLYLILVIFFSVFLIKNIIVFFTNYFQSSFIIKINHSIQKKLYKDYINKDYIYFTKNHSSKVLRNLTSEVALFSNSFLSPCLTLVSNVILIFFISTLLLIYDVFSTSIIILSVIFIMYLYKLIFSNYLKTLGISRQIFHKDYLKVVGETFNIATEIKLLKIQKFFEENFSFRLQNLYDNGIKKSIISPLPKIFYEIFFLLVLFFIIFINLESNTNLFTTLGVYVASIFRIIPSANAIASAYNKIKFSQATIQVVKDGLQKANNIKDVKLKTLEFKNTIVFEDINFSFEDNLIFSNLNFQIKKGEKIGIMGPSGSGKTTFINILMGLIQPTHGSIKVDGIDITNGIESWQKLISYVPQNVKILDESLKVNITFNNEEKKIDQIRYNDSLNKSQLNKFIEKFVLNEETKLGENGSQISQGEKQRIGIARAIYRNSQLLILDESTNFLDDKTKRLFLEEIKDNLRNLTIIFISHDKKSLEFCSKIFNLEDKKLQKIN